MKDKKKFGITGFPTAINLSSLLFPMSVVVYRIVRSCERMALVPSPHRQGPGSRKLTDESANSGTPPHYFFFENSPIVGLNPSGRNYIGEGGILKTRAPARISAAIRPSGPPRGGGVY